MRQADNARVKKQRDSRYKFECRYNDSSKFRRFCVKTKKVNAFQQISHLYKSLGFEIHLAAPKKVTVCKDARLFEGFYTRSANVIFCQDADK